MQQFMLFLSPDRVVWACNIAMDNKYILDLILDAFPK